MLKEKYVEFLAANHVNGAFMIKDLKGNQMFTYNQETVVPSASIIKLFILARIFQDIKDGKASLDEEILCSPEDVVPYSVLVFLSPRKYKLYELINIMIVYSDNTATNLLIDRFGFDRINKTIRDLGCEKTVLQRKMMDFEAAERGFQNYTCAEDMFSIMEKLYNHQLIGDEYSKQMIEIMKGSSGNSQLRQYLPEDLEVASKGGELDGLNHDVGIVYTEKGDYIFVFFVWDAVDCIHSREVLARASKMAYDWITER